MTFWLVAQLPPALAQYLIESFGVKAQALRAVGLRDATDREIFDAARQAGITIITKDDDFLELVRRLGTPPRIIWVTCGNATNKHLKQVFATTFAQARVLLAGGAQVVEIADAPADR
jgi:predicted nuclease of predicted toxin-antitoxin system